MRRSNTPPLGSPGGSVSRGSIAEQAKRDENREEGKLLNKNA